MVLNGVPRSRVLLDWSKWKNLTDFQNKIFTESKLAENLKPIYLKNWAINLVIGPNKVQNFYNFKNLKKNEFKPFLISELEKIENEPIPKWLKTYMDGTFEETMIAEIDSDEELYNYLDNETAFKNKQLKAEYIAKNGIWITNSKDGNPIPNDQKYKKLWEETQRKFYNNRQKQLIDEYLKKNNIEYDNKKQEYFTKKLNPDWPYKALYIDTINYNYWERLQEQLENLRSYYESLPDETPKSNKENPKQKDGKKYDPWCDKFYPLDYSDVFGIPISLPPPLFFVSTDLSEIKKVLNLVNNGR
jgi:hypothetical protein